MSKLSNKLSFIKKFISKNYGIGKITFNLFSNLVGANKRIEQKSFKRRQTSSFLNGINTITRYKTLKKNIKINILFLIENKTYKGIRHKSGQPVRGQRTHTNAKTKRKIT
jgi:small subunit ribosomal protein S13